MTSDDRKGGGASAAPSPGEWCYDLSLAPRDATRILGLWHFSAPDGDVIRIIWRSNREMAGMIYVTHEGSDGPHYMPDPHAFALFPEIRRPPQ